MLVHPMEVDNVTLFDYPITLLEEGQVSSIPVMLGFTKDEGAMIGEKIIFLLNYMIDILES